MDSSLADRVPVLSVWACGQRSEAVMLADARALAETHTDLGRVPAGVARAAIFAYSRAGQTVADPDAGTGTVLSQAVCTGRHAIGLVTEPGWLRIARGNITAAKRAGAWPDATVLTAAAGKATEVGRQRVDLAVTALRATQPGCGADPVVLLDDATARLTEALARCTPWLRRGARVVVAVPLLRGSDGVLLDTVGAVYSAARVAGLVPDARCGALTATVRGRRIVPPHRRRASSKASRATVPVHWDVQVLRLPEFAIRTSAVSLLPQPRDPSGARGRGGRPA